MAANDFTEADLIRKWMASSRTDRMPSQADPIALTDACRVLSGDEVDEINIALERAVSLIDIVRVHLEGVHLPELRRKTPAAVLIAAAEAIDQVDALINQGGTKANRELGRCENAGVRQ